MFIFIHNISGLPRNNRWIRFRTRRWHLPCRQPTIVEWTKWLRKCSVRRAGRRRQACPSWTIPVWQWLTWYQNPPNLGWCSSNQRSSWGKWALEAGRPFRPVINRFTMIKAREVIISYFLLLQSDQLLRLDDWADWIRWDFLK